MSAATGWSTCVRSWRRVEALGGEGLMLRQPGSEYVVGRSTALLEVKTFQDAEARVVDYAPGTGKHKGRVGGVSGLSWVRVLLGVADSTASGRWSA